MSTHSLASIVINGLAIAALLYIGYDKYLSPDAREPRPSVKEQRAAVGAERIQAGPYVASTAQISASETIREVRFPDAMAPDLPMLDRSCILYTNNDWQTATLGCPPADIGLPATE